MNRTFPSSVYIMYMEAFDNNRGPDLPISLPAFGAKEHIDE